MRRYLIVDDNVAFAENLAEIVRDADAEAMVAASGEEALDLLQRHRFDVLVTDMRMPGMDGACLVHEARQKDPGLPFIAVSAWADEGMLKAARTEGILAVLPKPTPVEELLRHLERARRDAVVALVDDDVSLVDNLREALQDRGFSSLVATSLSETKELRLRPRLAVVDLRMPGGPDATALRCLRDRFPALPMLVISAFPDSVPAAELPLVFTKPFDTSKLLATVESMCP